MNAPSVATEENLQRTCAAFQSISWPLSREELLAITTSLDWTIVHDLDRVIYFISNLSRSSLPNAKASLSENNVLELTLDISDETTEKRELTAQLKTLKQSLTSILGTPDGFDVGSYWELDNGGRFKLLKLSSVIVLSILQPAYADIERGEERHGISPDRDPLA
ncbi:hypothetical protein F8O01_16345 [Pseudoclavibacter chungangensis]|uniref:Uncharacterized protein n=1 Tax=Pseudoclavibacter chungangensis TaxID=587635 RepID=A0A7J5BMM2_9MICO|nr:DUF6301 family protein [Pseudoclavibacter chungangensis]KAB1652751.1 hypothetical protein F8O01_16345 [Pseudoclavibacter chungangensis]NYJ68029.1 hypothetical protein [Pseudoclavibacter chungangensis]